MVDFFSDSAILFSVREIKNNMKNTMTMTEIRRHFNLRNRREAVKKANEQLALRVQALRRADMKEWKALQLDMTTAESDRPTWEQFKREANLKRIGKAAEIVVTRRRMPNIL